MSWSTFAVVDTVGEHNPFSVELVVGEADIDDLNHANNVAYLRWIQDVAVAHSEAVGLDFEAYRKRGSVFVVRRHEIDYLRPLLLGTRISLRTWIAEVMAAKCVRATEIVAADGTVHARARTTWGYIDTVRSRPTRITDSIRIAFGQPPRASRRRDESG